MAIFESGEMYMETILLLSKKMNTVRAIDVGNEMGFSKPSVSRGLKHLKEEGMILVDSNGYITFTEEGRKRAEKVYDRHTYITKAFKILGVDDENAENDACKIEHIISDETFDVIKKKVIEYENGHK